MLRPTLLSPLLSLALLLPAAAHAGAAIEGRYLAPSGNLEVEIAPCGNALCGTVTKVLANRSMSNPQAAMQPADGRSPLGMKIFTDLMPSAGGSPVHWQGQIYNREVGKSFPAKLSLDGQRDLTVAIGPNVVQTWSRVGQLQPGDQP